jgi:hypothetical protein
MFAMHCFKRLQNQRLDREIYTKISGDLAKAIALKQEGRWEIETWTFISNYPITEEIAAPIVQIGAQAGIDVSWRGPQYLANALQRHPEVHEQFPNLQVYDVVEQLRELRSQIGQTSGDFSLDLVSVGIPRSSAEQRALLAQRPQAWEYLLFAGALWQGRERIQPKLRDHELRLAQRADRYMDLREAIPYFPRALRQASRISEGLMRVFDPGIQRRAFGGPGEPGDPDRIDHLASRVVGAAEELLDWAANLRAIQVPSELAEVFELTAQAADQPLEDILGFIEAYVIQAEGIPELLAQPGDETISLSLTLTLTVDEELLSSVNAKFDQVVRTALQSLRDERT